MRKIVCPTCEFTKRPYGFPRGDRPRPGSPNQKDFIVGVYEYKCDKCGQVMFVRLDHILELAPVDIKEVNTPDGIACEIVEEKRGEKKNKYVLKRVDDESV